MPLLSYFKPPTGATEYGYPVIINALADAVGQALKNHITGFTYANSPGDLVNDIDIAAGGAMDSTGAFWISGAALTKRSDAAWAVGTNAGGLDTGAVGNSGYYIWLIARSDTGVVDALFSLSSTAPTMPANYDYKRKFGYFLRVGGTIVLFKTYETEGGGIRLNWQAPTTDISLLNTLTTATRTDSVKVPQNVVTLAHLNVQLFDASSGCVANITCPDQDSPALSSISITSISLVSTTARDTRELHILTNASGQINSRASIATVDEYYVVTVGFTWARRN